MSYIPSTRGNISDKYSITLHYSVLPVQCLRCRVPIEGREEIETQLRKMTVQDTIFPKVEPAPWVSLLSYPYKDNGTKEICLDPNKLNKERTHEHHKTPTLEKNTHKLTGSTTYFKLDGKKIWSIHLTQESSLITMFNKHLVRYCFKCMPFSLKKSKNVFQMKMDKNRR